MLRADIKEKALHVLAGLTPANDREKELIAALRQAVSNDDTARVHFIARAIFSGTVDLDNPLMPAIDWVCSIVYSWHKTYGEH